MSIPPWTLVQKTEIFLEPVYIPMQRNQWKRFKHLLTIYDGLQITTIVTSYKRHQIIVLAHRRIFILPSLLSCMLSPAKQPKSLVVVTRGWAALTRLRQHDHITIVRLTDIAQLQVRVTGRSGSIPRLPILYVSMCMSRQRQLYCRPARRNLYCR